MTQWPTTQPGYTLYSGMESNARKVVCALDTSDLSQAISIVRKLGPFVGAFKIGHALTLAHGLDVIPRLQDAGTERIFLDLKFHDIPNSVAIAVAEAAQRSVWMMTLHITGGPAMLAAAVESARAYTVNEAPLLVGVSVLTSLDEHTLHEHLGVRRPLSDHMVQLSRMAVDFGLDGVVCSALEVRPIRDAIGHQGIIVTPGIRLAGGEVDDQKRVGTAQQALTDGASYLVIGRALTDSADPAAALDQLGLVGAA